MITYDSIAAMKFNRFVLNYTQQLNKVNEQIKTQSLINKASDNPTLFSFTSKVNGNKELYSQLTDNATTGIALVDTATNAISNMEDKLGEIKKYLTKAAKAGMTSTERAEIQTKIDKLVKEVYDIRQNTGFNGLQIFERTSSTPITGILPEETTSTTEVNPYIRPVERKSDEEWEADGFIVIHNKEEFITELNNDLYGYYVLGNDIDLEGIDWTPIGTSDNSFCGGLIGNGYKISNLTINQTSSENVGLFGYINDAYIQDIALENVTINGLEKVGAIAGYSQNSYITNSYVTNGTVEAVNSAVGVLVGYSYSSNIEACYTDLELVKGSTSSSGGLVGFGYQSNIQQSYSKSNVEGYNFVGGLIGSTVYSDISNSYSSGTVKGSSDVGGFIGTSATTTIDKSYTTASVTSTGGGYIGGFIGELTGNAANNVIKNSFYDKDTTGQSIGVGYYNSATEAQTETLIGLSSVGMQTTSNYLNAEWDPDIWIFSAGNDSYPLLKEQNLVPLPDAPTESTYYGPLKSINGPIRVQTGKDATLNSCVMVDTAFKFDNHLNFNVTSQDWAKTSLINMEIVLDQLSQKSYELNISRKELVSEAKSDANKAQQHADVSNALIGVDMDNLQKMKSQLLSDIANAKALRDSTLNLNAQVCKTLLYGTIYGQNSSSWLTNLLTT